MSGHDDDREYQTKTAAPPIISHARTPPLRATADDGDGGDDVTFVLAGAGTGAGAGVSDGDEAFLSAAGDGGKACRGGVAAGGGDVDDFGGEGGGANARGAGGVAEGGGDGDLGGGVCGEDGDLGGGSEGGDDGVLPPLLRTARTTTMRRSPALHRPASALMKK
jgi:hypothetical protein